MGRARRLAAAMLGAILALAPAQAQPSAETVKAAFLPRFARYVTWPPAARPAAGQPFILCMIGSDPFGDALDRASAGQSIDGHRIVVRRIDSPAAAHDCNIAFVQAGRGQQTGQLLAALRAEPVLTVTDSRGGAQRGIIHFVIVGGRVRFFIDQAAAAQRGLTISSRLLALAVGVNQR